MGNAWVIVSAPDEATVAPDFVWDGDEFRPIADLDDAFIYSDGNYTVEQVRAIQGDFQARFTDRDVRMRRVSVTVAFA